MYIVKRSDFVVVFIFIFLIGKLGFIGLFWWCLFREDA